MAVFILVHGGAHGGWCWEKLVPELEKRGHRALAPDLAGMGEDRTPIAEVTMQRWSEDIAELARQQGEPVVLVGHSRGGPVISEAGEIAPETILGLVYLTALLLPAGTTSMDMFVDVEPALMQNVAQSADGTAMIINPDAAQAAFYHRADQRDVERALDRLCPEPLGPNSAPSRVTEERWGRLPRAFIECTDDRALPLATQRKMQEALPCDPVITLDSDHSPFLCMPDAVADALETIAAEFITRRAQAESA